MRSPFRAALLLLLFLGGWATVAGERGGHIVVVTGCASLRRAIEATSTTTGSTSTSTGSDGRYNNGIRNSDGSGRGSLTLLLHNTDDSTTMHCAESIHISPTRSIVLLGAPDGSSVISIAPDLGLLSLAPSEAGERASLFVNEGMLRIDNVSFRLHNSRSSSSRSSSSSSTARRRKSPEYRTGRRKMAAEKIGCGARVALNSGHLVIANSRFDRSLAEPSSWCATTGGGVVHSDASGTILVRNSTFGVASQHGAAIIHAEGTESVVIENSVFHQDAGGAAASIKSVGGSRISGPDTHIDFATSSSGSSRGFDIPAEFAIGGSYGSGVRLDAHRDFVAGGNGGSVERNEMGTSGVIFAGPGVELSVTGSTFVLGPSAATAAAAGSVLGGALSCHGAVIRGCTFVLAGPCSEGIGGAVTSNRQPTSASNRPLLIEGSTFRWEWTAGVVGCAVVVADGGDLAISNTSFKGVGGSAVSFEPSSFGDEVNRLGMRRCEFSTDNLGKGNVFGGSAGTAAAAAATAARDFGVVFVERASSKVAGTQTILEIACGTKATTGCGGGGVMEAMIDTAKFDRTLDCSNEGPEPSWASQALRASRGLSVSRRLDESNSGLVLDQGLLLVMVTVGLLLVVAGLCCLDVFLRKYPRSFDFLRRGGGGGGGDRTPAGAGRHRRTPVSTP